LFKCRAGCDQQAVLDGLRARELWGRGGDQSTDSLVHADLGRPDVVYRYLDADGGLIGVVCRWEARGTRKKEIRPAQWQDGRWRWKAFENPRPMFRLPDLAAEPDKAVLVVEGEKACDAARELITTHICTTWPGGTGTVEHADIAILKGRDVTLWPDNDAAGRAAMRKLADRLVDARSVRGVKLPPGLPPSWDLGDSIPADLDPVALIGRAVNVRAERLAGLGLINAASLLSTNFKPPKWAVPTLVPEGLTIFAGRPKCGKSWLALDVCAAVGGGGNALGSIQCEPGWAIYLALEDTPRRLAGRLRAVLQGAPAPQQLTIATNWRRADAGGIADLRAWLMEHPEARLVVVDTLALIRGEQSGRDRNVYTSDYEAITGFKQLADEFGVAVVLVHHTKKESAADPLDSVSGTHGLTGSADTIIVLDRKPNDLHAMLYVRGRDVPEEEIALQFERETGRWLKLGPAEDFRRSQERREVIRLLSTSVDPLMPVEIASSLERNRAAIRKLLMRMHAAGEVEKLPNGRYYVLKT
jgi:hypothetical protein